MILVTGGTGLVGAYLLLHLVENGHKVRSLYRNQNNILKTKNLFDFYKKAYLFEIIEWVEGNILNIPSLEVAFKDIEYVYHCAAIISFDPNDEEKLRKTNIEGTANMVNCALAFNIKKFCHVSSIAALGDTKTGENIITEETEWNPEKNHGDYAITKYGAEMEVWRACQEGLNIIIVNPGVIFGFGFWDQGSGKTFKAVQKGQSFYTKGSTGVVAAEDVVTLMTNLMASAISGEKFTIVAQNINFDTLLTTIAKGMNKEIPSIYAKPWLTNLAWKMDWFLSKVLLKKRSFTKSMAKSAHTTDIYSNKKIISVTNYNFTDMESYIYKLSKNFIPSQN